MNKKFWYRGKEYLHGIDPDSYNNYLKVDELDLEPYFVLSVNGRFAVHYLYNELDDLIITAYFCLNYKDELNEIATDDWGQSHMQYEREKENKGGILCLLK